MPPLSKTKNNNIFNKLIKKNIFLLFKKHTTFTQKYYIFYPKTVKKCQNKKKQCCIDMIKRRPPKAVLFPVNMALASYIECIRADGNRRLKLLSLALISYNGEVT